MPYDSFDSVANLDTEAQKELLHRGDSVERVWAAWALGLNFGERVIPELLRCLEQSPESGTRRHLIVVLAGLGERAVLKSYARHDPDEFVRATACRYLIRTAQPQDGCAQRILLDRLLEDISPSVRLTILQESKERLPSLRVDHLAKLMEDTDPEVRHHALERWGGHKNPRTIPG